MAYLCKKTSRDCYSTRCARGEGRAHLAMKTPKHVDLSIGGSNEDGTPATVKALAPVIVSASRSTDIPAFYAEWLGNRLKEGYCIWYNPFNAKPSYISFCRTRIFVFWSKNPAPLIPYLEEFDRRGIGYYFQFTLNDYVMENFEPNVGSLQTRIEIFKKLSSKIGRKRVIWRFDPIIMVPGRTYESIIEKIWNIGKQLKGYTEKLVFSFVDIAAYKGVWNNMVKTVPFTKENILFAEATQDQVRTICEGLANLRDRWQGEGWELNLATCAEKVDLTRYGIEHNCCIDDVLLQQLYPHDSVLMDFLEIKRDAQVQGNLLQTINISDNHPVHCSPNPRLKDKGQREECGCIISKDIGSYNTCPHFCIYCYANRYIEFVKKNRERYSPNSKSIITSIKSIA